MQHTILIAIAIAVVAGCGGRHLLFTKDYAPPSTGPTATLRFDMLPRALVGIYADESCAATGHGSFVNGHVRSGNPPFLGGHIRDVVGIGIPARPGLTVGFSSLENVASPSEMALHGRGFTRKCNVTLTFIPVAGATYEGVYRFDAFHQTCTAEIYRVEPADLGERRVQESSVRPAKERCVLL